MSCDWSLRPPSRPSCHCGSLSDARAKVVPTLKTEATGLRESVGENGERDVTCYLCDFYRFPEATSFRAALELAGPIRRAVTRERGAESGRREPQGRVWIVASGARLTIIRL